MMSPRERAEETFQLIRALGRMDASMIPFIERAIVSATAELVASERQAREAVLKAGRDPKWAAVYAWMDDHKDEAMKSAVEASGESEQRSMVAEEMAEKYRDALMSLIHEMCSRRPEEHPCLCGDSRCNMARRTLGWNVIRGRLEDA